MNPEPASTATDENTHTSTPAPSGAPREGDSKEFPVAALGAPGGVFAPMKTTSGSIVIQNSEFYEIYRGKSDRIIIRQEMDGETHHLSVSPDRAEKLAAAILDIAKQIPQ